MSQGFYNINEIYRCPLCEMQMDRQLRREPIATEGAMQLSHPINRDCPRSEKRYYLRLPQFDEITDYRT